MKKAYSYKPSLKVIFQLVFIAITNWCSFSYCKTGQRLLWIKAAFIVTNQGRITANWGSYYKLGQIYYKYGQLLQIRAIISNWWTKVATKWYEIELIIKLIRVWHDKVLWYIAYELILKEWIAMNTAFIN